MRRAQMTAAAVLALSLAGALWRWPAAPEPSAPTTQQKPETPAQTARQQVPATAPADGSTVAEALAAWRALHQPVGYLSQEETEALIAQRTHTAEALAAAIAALRGEALAALHEDLRAAERSRDKLVMIDGLGRNPATEALTILADVYDGEPSYTLKSTVLRALGDSPADGHHELLVEQMWAAEDERLQQISAQGLYGEAEAAAALIDAVHSELPIKVRLEAIHSLGATGTDEARAALERIQQDDALEARVRVYAGKELGRSFG